MKKTKLKKIRRLFYIREDVFNEFKDCCDEQGKSMSKCLEAFMFAELKKFYNGDFKLLNIKDDFDE